ncbi:MAG: hypothetical protein PHU85_06755 [Phycisphaerae bacterium]|nr:hypothetical protein [Phycisphaerae bacterium]
MRIEIVEIDRATPVLICGGVALGYRGHFRCPLTVGAAVIVPCSNREDALRPGARISVETDQESISEFRVLPSRSQPKMTPLANPGDYEIVGEVSAVFDDGVAHIEVEGFSFVLGSNDAAGAALRTGQCVGFKLHQLSLWDENI